MGRSILRGGSVLAAGTLVERLARFGRNMVLTRIIAPDQFGLMAIVLATIALFEAITEVGVSQAVIQNRRGKLPEFLNVAWWINTVRGLAIFVIAAPLSPLIAAFYSEPTLAPILVVAFSSMVFAGMTSPKVYALQRQFRFGESVAITQGAGLLGTGLTLVLGMVWQNVWALVIGTVFEAFVRFVLSFVLCPIRPSLRIDKQSRRELFAFTKGMMGLAFMTFLVSQADIFVLGRVASTQVLGLYSMAVTLAMFPQSLFAKIVQPLVVPILTAFQDSIEQMRAAYLRLERLVWLFGLPMAATMTVAAKPLLTVVYGLPYAAVAVPFGVIAFYFVVYMASMVSFSVYLAMARPELQRSFTLLRALLLVASIYPLSVTFGPVGAASSVLGALVLAMLLQVRNLKRVIGLGFVEYLGTLRAGVLAGLVVGALVWLIGLLGVPVLARAALSALPLLGAWSLLALRERAGFRALRAGK
ncbi:MAG: oligosaccharide flippase family protein [Acidobacteriota bacterium]|nr:oligosaccharide flippase family protein [Acidobacteriota bacterium]